MTMKMIRHFIYIILGGLILLPSSYRAGFAQEAVDQTQYFSSIPDLPLMEGLRELPDETLTFDKPEGRIIEVYAVMEEINREDILVFYRGTLPQLGWSPDGPTRFYRQDEYLDLEFKDGPVGDILKFMISPAL